MPFFQGYIAQGVGSSTGFVENTLSGYARQPVTIGNVANGNTTLAAAVYTPVTNTVTVTQRALFDASTAGNLIMWWNLDNPPTIQAGGTDTLKVNSLSHTYPALYNGAGNGVQAVDFLSGAKIGTTAGGNAIYAGHFIEVVNGVVAAKTTV